MKTYGEITIPIELYEKLIALALVADTFVYSAVGYNEIQDYQGPRYSELKDCVDVLRRMGLRRPT